MICQALGMSVSKKIIFSKFCMNGLKFPLTKKDDFHLSFVQI